MITDAMFASGKFWNKGPMVVTGCTKVSPGCKNCWSEADHKVRCRNPKVQYLYRTDSLTDGRFNGKVYFNLDRLKDAVKGKTCVISPWNDIYHPLITDEQICDAFEVMAENKHHTYLIITKRIERAASFWPRISGTEFGPHIIHIATMENQDMADKRMPHLLRIPSKRGIIIEPMLGSVDIRSTYIKARCRWGQYDSCVESPCPHSSHSGCQLAKRKMADDIHQVILGPENGAGKRPFKEEWAESVRAQCESAGVPFYRKDRGEGELIWANVKK